MSFPVFSARYTRIAPDSNNGSGLPPGPFGSRIAGILLFGFSDKKSGDIWSFVSKLTRCGSYGRPVSSSMMETFTPFGVGREYNCSLSGCWAGHLRVIGKAERSAMGVLVTAMPHRTQGVVRRQSL